jgi:rhodanese-related sulfurtransferase
LPGNKTTALVVVCASGMRSGKAVSQLKEMGYENAQSLRGGLAAWRAANLPVEKA